MKKSKKIILKCITALMIISCISMGNKQVTQALFIDTVKSYEINSYRNSSHTGTRYQYKDITFKNTYWLINKAFSHTVWNGIATFDHYYVYNYGTN